MRAKAKNVFIIITHSTQPTDEKTQVTEKCEFVDQIKDRHNTQATVILDYLNETIVKNRDNTGSYNEYVWYVTKNYPQQMGELAKEYKSGE